MKTMTPSLRRAALLSAVALLLFAGSAVSQAADAAPAASTTTVAAAAIPLASVSLEAVSAFDNVQDVETELSGDPVTGGISAEWPSFTRELTAHLTETSRLLRAHPSLDDLRREERILLRLTHTLDDWNRNLTRRADQLNQKKSQVDRSVESWKLTLGLVQAPDTPVQVTENVRNVIAALAKADDALDNAERDVLSLQNRVTQADHRLDASLASLKQTREQVVNHVLKRDSAPLWQWNLSATQTGAASVNDTEASFSTEFTGLTGYARRETGSFLLHLVVLAFLIVLVHWIRRRLLALLVHEPILESASSIFNSPTSIAIVLAMAAGAWIYPAPPRLLKTVLTAIAVVPGGLILRQWVGQHFRPVPTMLLGFFFADHLRNLLAGSPVLSRLALLAETGAGIAAAAWIWRRMQSPDVPGREKIRRRRLDIGVRLALLALIAAFIGNGLGFLNFATLVANATFSSAYVAVLLFAIIRALSVLTMVVLRVPPVGVFRIARLHRRALWRNALYLYVWASFLLWLAFTLERLALLEPVWLWGERILTASLKIGAISLTLGAVAAFVLTIWAAVLISRAVRFLLEEEVYSHFPLPAGMPYAISRTVHYVILAGGFVAAVAALGFDMTKFTILMSAFSVGLGFGMQNILNNFASGIILLFERPVKVGDVVEISGATGVIERIGIRATLIRTGSGSRVILPNGNLISNNVTNWTSGLNQRIIEIPLTAPATIEPSKVLADLVRLAQSDPRIAKDPPPQAVVTKLSSGGNEYALRVWTSDDQDVLQIKSDLTIAFNATLQKEAAASS